MLATIILVLVLAVATCIIAYVADNLGKKLGKKRVSLWGLRPRQTATLLTMASGLGIMFTTLFVLLGLWGPLRHALLSYDRVRANSRALSAQNRDLQRNLKTLDLQSQNLEKQAERSRQRADAAQQQVRLADHQLNKVRGQLSKAQTARATAVRAENAARRGEKAARQRAENAQQRFIAARQRLNNSQLRLAQVESTLNRARNGLVKTRHELAVARRALGSTRLQLTTAQKSVETTKRATLGMLQAWRELQGTVARQEARVKQLEAAEKQQEAEVSGLQARRVELETLIEQLGKNAELAIGEIVTGQVIISIEQPFAERQLPPRPSADQAQAALRELLAEGNRVAGKFGADSLELNPIPIPVGSQSTLLNQEQILALLVKHLATFETPVSVRLIAARNHFAGEKAIMARLEVLPVRTAFSRGQVIASATIDGRQSDAKIFNQLLTLVNEGEKVARERKVTPPLTPDDPHFYGPDTNERIFAALRQVQETKGPAQVRLVAAEDISTVEAMNVRFDVAPP